jgi:hypothetical protein
MRRSIVNHFVRLTAVGMSIAAAATPLDAQASTSPSGRPPAATDRRVDSLAVITVAYDVVRAISTRDTTLGRALMLPGSMFVRMLDPDAPPTPPRYQSDSAFVASLAAPGPRYLERIWSPSLFLQGTVAQVHAPYDFYIDGVFSHCGVDTFTMVKTRGAWRISHSAYTVQKTGCPPSPLGAPSK